ncbi:MAG: peptide chain release factor 1 [Candidatus Neomarinimicrobiota bacterium]
MRDKLQTIIDKHSLLSEQLADPEIFNDQKKLTTTAKEHSALEDVVNVGKEYLAVLQNIEDDKSILDGHDAELKEIAQEELIELESRKDKLESDLKILLLPRDPNDDKNLILEIRAGTGGDEAALFAANLFRVYTRYAERKNWEYKVMDSSDTGIGGIKEAIVSIQGKGAFGMLKYESGVHRVQRVPKTETSGRVHTSAATIAVLPEAEDVDIEVNDSDLKIDTYRASGAGGQHVNKTESAIRITHIPTGLVVTCQDESSQHKNRAAALKVLKSRLLASEQEKAAAERAAERRSLVSTGDRSAKIRTYNFPQGRVTDHRINFTSYKLNEILDGDITEVIEKLKIAEQQELMASDI